MSILNVHGLTKYYGAAFIFGAISFQVARGDKIALVGVNGAGKSTLLKIVAGIEQPTQGAVQVARGTRLAYLAQEARFGQRTLWEEMEAALDHLTALQREMHEIEHMLADPGAPDWEQHMQRYGELMQRFEHGGGYETDYRIKRTLHGLGFNPAQYHQPVAQFSGGQKTRVALAATLLSDPDLLLLDEPTNHLDLAALEWLERFLKDWDGTLIVISHDRYFLDKVTNRTLELAFGRLEDYPAPYHRYLELKAERLELQLKQYQAQQEYIARTEEFIRRFKAGQRSKEARGRERRLQRLKAGWEGVSGKTETLIERPEHQKRIGFALDTQLRGGDLVLKLDRLVVGYHEGQATAGEPGGHAPGDLESQRPETARQRDRSIRSTPDPTRDSRVELIRCPDLEIQRGQRVALMGPNGSGKTTLLRTIVGELPPLRGKVRLGHRIAINYYAQAHEGLRMDATVLDEIRRVAPQIQETQARTLLGRFLFSNDDVFKRIADLSGGERSRVALAQLTVMGGNLLVLDEPTNHLDISAREALEAVLNEYNGTILFVSHDRYFVDAVADTIWMVQDGSIEAFDGTYSEYAAYREAREQRAENRESVRMNQHVRPGAGAAGPTPARRPAPGAQGDPHAAVPPDRGQAGRRDRAEREERRRQRRLAALEAEIAMLEAELKQIEHEINQAGAQGDASKVTALGLQYAEIQEMLNTRYDEWAAVAG